MRHQVDAHFYVTPRVDARAMWAHARRDVEHGKWVLVHPHGADVERPAGGCRASAPRREAS